MTETTSDTQGGSTKSGVRVSRRGLTIERVYTSPGVHPYDEVTWERRDVVMTNWRDGTINFEQRGVEFPDFWSVNAANIVTTKYFRGAVGTEQREWSLKQLIDRVVLTYVKAGQVNGYFATVDDATIFEHELTYALLHQVFSFNSPVWFNVGTNAPAQVSACFILAVDDKMDSILDWYKEEGMIFKGGSGSGINLSRIRSSKELLSSGGTASGPVSFMRGADASAGTIKSGGATRRAAKMVILDVDHPDVEEFIETKAREEDKIRVLRDAGYDMDLGGRDMSSVQYQNANNSVRVNEEFMRAYEKGSAFGLKARTDGSVIDTVDAKSLMRKIAQAAWECADPGIQYDDTINDWHTTPETGRITASNPCFPADQRVVTDKGLIRIGELVARAAQGETFSVYTNDVTAEHNATAQVVATDPLQYMVTGTNEILELRFSDGSRLRCTPGHRIWTSNRGWVHAEDLQGDDRVVRSFHEALRPMASINLPARAARVAKRANKLNLPEKWDDDFAHFLGWLIGDGCLTADTMTTVYGSNDDKTTVLPRHQKFLADLTGFDAKPSVQANGTLQLRSGKSDVVKFFEAMGVTQSRAKNKVVPEAVFEAPDDVLVSFLQGLFDADGCVVNQVEKGTRYVGLGSRSEELLIGVQELLASLGIASRIYEQAAKKDSFSYVRKDGSEVTYSSDGSSFDLRISGRSIRDFAALISFSVPAKVQRLAQVVDYHSAYNVDETVQMVGRESRGFETTYNLTEPRNHSYIVSGFVVANCSEYMHLDNSSCNLASLNLMKFLKDDDSFDAVAFAKVVEFVITAMDISICFADFPTEKIGDTTRKFRQLGIGYANLGALLMATGHAYDSDGGRALAAGITSLMTGTAYKRSAELAGVVGPYEGYARNAEAHTRVMRKHAAASDSVRSVGIIDREVIRMANKAWQDGLKIGEKNGWRNSQASVLAPTGCLTGDTMVTTDRGLTRLSELGDIYGDRWQDVDFRVSTDDGPREATKFFVNGEEPTRRIVTSGGYRVQGTLTHRVKVIDAAGEWAWKRLADVVEGDVVPMQLGTMIGEPRRVPLPVLDQAYYAGDRHTYVPDAVDENLSELVGYFMGDGSLHAKGIRLCVADTDLDVVDRIRVLSKGLFGIEPVVTAQQGYQEVTLQSVRLARWWQAAGFAKSLPNADHIGKGWTPRVPSALLETNDINVYTAFLRGLFEADGTVLSGVPSVFTSSESFAAEIRTLLIAVGLPTTTRETVSASGERAFEVRLRDLDAAQRLIDGSIPGQVSKASGYIFEEVTTNEDGGVQPTYDLSVPSNVTYVAAGFVSHNTIGLMMDCDTTGIEPDLALVKFKKLVGGGSMQIVNQTVPRALRNLGYQEEQVEAIVEHIAEHGNVVDAPGLRLEHYEVFDCAMGERSISAMGHVRMMAAAQPFLSGAISKCVTGETLLATGDGLIRIDSLHQGERPDSFRDEILEVASLTGPQKTDAFYYGGERDVRDVVLRSGHKVTGTPNHRLLVATGEGLDWRYLGEIAEGEYVAVQYGSDLWSNLPARFDDFRPSALHGNQKTIRIPSEMTEELALLLGAFAAEGHIARTTHTVVLTNSVESVLERVVRAWQNEFGLTARITREPGKCPGVVVSSKTLVEFLDYLGMGGRASEKRIPDAVLRSPRSVVLSFLQGLALDAYTHVGKYTKWAICLDAPRLLDDLQAVLTNLGIVHSRISKYNAEYDKNYDEVFACGEEAREMVLLVPFLEPDKAENAARMVVMDFGQSTADVVPGITGRQLYEAIPRGKSGRNGFRTFRSEFAFLLDPRTTAVSRRTVERVAALPGVLLPQWVYDVIWDGLHFSPVVRVADAGSREVYDVSVPSTHAFVGNGIVNHNTVNLPETATVEDVEDVYYQGWKLGLKALAIYRNNCKVGQPLSDAREKKADVAVAVPTEYKPIRKRLPKRRPSQTVSFAVAGAEGYLTAGSYPDDGLGEVFLKLGKQGSTLAGVMDAFSIAISIALQYGVPLEAFVSKFVNMRFDPAGLTDDPDVRMAQSIMDYIFRRLALDYLPYETRAELGIFTADERAQTVAAKYDEPVVDDDLEYVDLMSQSAPIEKSPAVAGADAADVAIAKPVDVDVHSSTELLERQLGTAADAPLCMGCGTKMRPAGSCYVCEGCGSTSGCS